MNLSLRTVIMTSHEFRAAVNSFVLIVASLQKYERGWMTMTQHLWGVDPY
ncbi:hypothetical protein [Paenibacillus solani]